MTLIHDPATERLAFDCRHWKDDRPCRWHKLEGVECECEHYDRVETHVLIVKLDAMGDVLRSTCVLPGIRQLHPRAAIHWITRTESVPLLSENPLIDRVIPYGPDALLTLWVSRYDWTINLDAGRTSCELATLARATVKTGFVLGENGHIEATNPAARAWLEMGVSDVRKRANTETYQRIMGRILGVPDDSLRYVFHLAGGEAAAVEHRLRGLGWRPDVPTVGLATGAGGRWQYKQWREEGFSELIERLLAGGDGHVQILLLGGPEERERNARLRARFEGKVLDPGCENPVRQFAGLVRACSVVVTGDTLAMHLAVAQERRVVVLFGPTSHHEIELFGLGQKIYPALDCLCCYLMTCDRQPNCMEEIRTDRVYVQRHDRRGSTRRGVLKLDHASGGPAMVRVSATHLSTASRIAVVERPSTRSTRCRRPPYFATVAASTHSAPYSAPFTCTSGRTSSRNATGSASSNTWT
jgi:ADP-heptose:LPS heptosyltransferase